MNAVYRIAVTAVVSYKTAQHVWRQEKQERDDKKRRDNDDAEQEDDDDA